MSTSEQIKSIRFKSGLSQAAFAERFEIPLRTLENWEAGLREPPIYVLLMLDILVSHGWSPD